MLAAESPFALPVQMPAPGSPEAMALHKAACTEFDRRTHLTDAHYARLKIGDTHKLWTIDTVREVMDGDYSSLLGNEAYAASALSSDELHELLVLTTRREQQFEEAQRDLKLHEIHALAFLDNQEDAEAVEGGDPIFDAIREHKAAYAVWLPHLRAINETPLSDPGYSALEAAAEEPGNREHEAYEALSEVIPTTSEGLIALASYLPGAVLRNSCTNADTDAMNALGAICGAVKELIKLDTHNEEEESNSYAAPGFSPTSAINNTTMQAGETCLARMVIDYFGNGDIDPAFDADIALRDRARAIIVANEWLEEMRGDGFVPYPANRPTGLMNVRFAIPAEAERLLGIAQAEFDRRAGYYASCPPTEREEHLTRMRAEYRLDELAAVVAGRTVVGA